MTIALQVLEPSVVFSKNYLSLSRVNVKRAIALLVTGIAEPLDFSSEIEFGQRNFPQNTSTEWLVRSPSLVIAVPSHIRATTSTERLWKPPVIVLPPWHGESCNNFVNRREVLRRDNHTYQCCGSNSLTLDHVMPLSKGGQHRWDNVVRACEKCNQRQSNRTPLKARMPLRNKPRAPMHPSIAFGENFWRFEHFRPGIGGNPRLC